MRRSPSVVNSSVTPSVESSAAYCIVSEESGSVRIRTKSSTPSASSSTRMGSRPWSSGIRSDGFERWKAPEAMNRMWSVRTIPYRVETVEPSTSGRRSRWTPSRETSGPASSPRWATLSISSRNTIPFCSTSCTARVFSSSSLTSFPASSSVRSLKASRTLSRRERVRRPARFWNMPWS